MGRIILPKKVRSHRILLFVSDTCKPCMGMVDELIKNQRNIMYEIVEVMDLSPWGSTPYACDYAKDWNITRVPTLVVLSNITNEPVEKIVGDKHILQNLKRICEKYWARNV